ncbi:hypothetical protein A3860_05030 [Niastella vici]|uniref:Thioesterase domain-containing protein n=1 Tax=Niastella vici TaxID=1703345 RepID=A0A1V9FRV2_9BACT|nr:alpha/beta fold hydrolase [Niastella vici]OQP61084.1 hypothetical protein A3860_05030 [Niastella vici]
MNAKKIKLFCLPYAGGTAAYYDKWKPLLFPCIEMIPVELAGRGKRMHEPFSDDVSVMVEDVVARVSTEINDSAPYAFFGHSMGGLLAYLVACRLEETRGTTAAHLFISAKGAPHIQRPDRTPYHSLPREEFVSAIVKLGATPAEVFEYDELLDLFMPLLRCDFRIGETVLAEKDIRQLSSDITILTGSNDDILQEQVEGWKSYTRKKYNIHVFDGGHFFINEHVKSVTDLINDQFKRCSRCQLH